ncbi:LAGLIDADG family homing endonuclease [Streptomyces sp. NPDC059755]|uniref:LAGLIDADG family homing endonuclease n=1 Tax=Streptomyces sp. NPDC059755 TaxID=3346934 RepID=UPI0036682ADC
MADCEPEGHRFMDLRVPEYAYMFGFLQADGHLSQQSRQRGRLTVELNELGLPYGHKSRTVAPPHGDFSPRDYLRGVIDADGSVGYTSKGFPFISLTTASTAIGTYLCGYAREITDAERNIKRNARDAIYNILYTNENAQKLAADLYYSDCLALERKKSAADSLRCPAGRHEGRA